jgi:hypothetical protein
MDEDITENYNLARFVSGALEVFSATLPGGFIPIQGIINASQYQELPDLTTLSFQTIMSYKRNNVDVVSGQPVFPGIIALAHPNGQHEYQPFDTNAVFSTDNKLIYQAKFTEGLVPTGSPWIDTIPGPGFIIFDTDIAIDPLPPNLFGKLCLSINAQYTATSAVPPGIREAIVRIFYDTITDAGVIVLNEMICRIRSIVNSVGDPINMNFHEYIEVPSAVRRVRIDVGGGNLTCFCGCFLLEAPEYYQEGFGGPGSLIGFSGFSAGLGTPPPVLQLSGTANYEVVPNSQLSRQIRTGFRSGHENINDMLVAEAFLADSEKHGLQMILPRDEYKRIVESGRFFQMSDKTFLGQASGFTDWIKGMYSSFAPVIKSVLPALGSILGSRGANLGNAIADFLPESEAEERLRGQAAVYRMRGQASGHNPPIKVGEKLRIKDFAEEYVPPLYTLPEPIKTEMAMFLSPFGSITPSQLSELLDDSFSESESEDSRGQASLLGSPFWATTLAKAQALATVVSSQVELQDAYPIDGLPMDTEMVSYANNFLKKGKYSTQAVPVTNRFPILFSKDGARPAGTSMGSVTVSGSPIVAVGGATATHVLLNKLNINIYVSSDQPMDASLIPTALCSVLAVQSTLGEVSNTLYIAFNSGYEWSGSSFGAALYASIRGLVLNAPITGAVGPLGSFYRAADWDKKQLGINARSLALFAVSDLSDLAPGEKTYAIAQSTGSLYNTQVGNDYQADALIMITNLAMLPMLSLMGFGVRTGTERVALEEVPVMEFVAKGERKRDTGEKQTRVTFTRVNAKSAPALEEKGKSWYAKQTTSDQKSANFVLDEYSSYLLAATEYEAPILKQLVLTKTKHDAAVAEEAWPTAWKTIQTLENMYINIDQFIAAIERKASDKKKPAKVQRARPGLKMPTPAQGGGRSVYEELLDL